MRKGQSLIAVFILSIIAFALTAIMLYMMKSTTRMVGAQYHYRSALEVAKGVSQYLMLLMDEDKLCSYTDCSEANQPINLGSYATIGDYRVEAKLLRYIQDPKTGASIYSVEVKVVNTRNPEKHSTVDFVYKVE